MAGLVDHQYAKKHGVFVLVYKKPTTDLAKLLVKKRVTFSAQKEAIVRLVKCVAALHSKRLVHCGLAPESLVRYGPGEWKLLGLATCHKEGELVGSIKLVAGQLVPEIMKAKEDGELEGLKAHGAMDVWSIGELMLHTFAGKPLFVGHKEAFSALVKAHKVSYLVTFRSDFTTSTSRHWSKRGGALALLFTARACAGVGAFSLLASSCTQLSFLLCACL